MIHLTPSAIAQLLHMLKEREAAPSAGLRVTVEKGGCAGWQYTMQIAEPAAGDQIYREGGVALIVDNESLGFLEGSTIDYVDALNDTGFRVLNPNAARSCGCGTSFEPRGTD